MGFFRRMINKAVNTLGKGIEKIGEVTHIFSIEMAGFNLQCSHPVDECVDLDDDSTSIQKNIEISKRCNEYKENVMKQTRVYEDDSINKFRVELKDVLNSFNGLIDTNVTFYIDDKFIDDIHNVVKNYVAKVVSVDNEEYKSILKIEDDKIRSKNNDDFLKKVEKEVCKELNLNFNTKRIEIYKKIIADLEEVVNDNYVSLNSISEEYQELLKNKDNVDYQELKIKKLLFDLNSLDMISSLL